MTEILNAPTCLIINRPHWPLKTNVYYVPPIEDLAWIKLVLEEIHHHPESYQYTTIKTFQEQYKVKIPSVYLCNGKNKTLNQLLYVVLKLLKKYQPHTRGAKILTSQTCV